MPAAKFASLDNHFAQTCRSRRPNRLGANFAVGFHAIAQLRASIQIASPLQSPRACNATALAVLWPRIAALRFRCVSIRQQVRNLAVPERHRRCGQSSFTDCVDRGAERQGSPIQERVR